MKTKVIYISGGDVHSVSDIRAAFDEVRGALGLDTDTILFGVTVDDAEAIETTATHEQEIITNTEPVANIKVDAPQKKTKKTSARAKPEPEIIAEPAVEPETETPSEKVIPILSVLSGKGEPQPEAESESQDIVIEKVTIQEIETPTGHAEVVSSETITISDISDDEMPVAESDEEKTLEKLFEKIAPLREDHGMDDVVMYDEVDLVDDAEIPDTTDATLAKLATEFVTTQDTIISNPRAETSGKIGKLKNILPFKKAKRDDAGLMGDLFGWAGIAANDDEFTIPGFFTTASKK